MAKWGFYGRRTELAEIERLLSRGEFFFCSISGRRRIGKTSLIQEALIRRSETSKALYVQIPDSDERGVIQVFEDAVEDTFGDLDFAQAACKDFGDISSLLQAMWQLGFVTAVDEFQYFHRAALSNFLSHLQARVDKARAEQLQGGLFALGSIHTEMTAVLEDKTSPLFNRVTDRIQVTHWDFETLFEMFREHEISDPHQILFLWSIFEGVPKFYRDCFDHGVLNTDPNYRTKTLKKMFFEGSSPLRDEAENWFLRELRGRYDSVLKLIARMGPCSAGQLKAEYSRTGTGGETELGGYLQALIDKYQMVRKVDPMFAPAKARRARYEIADNFLMAWLSSISRNVQFARVRPIDDAVDKASEHLMKHEGFTFEKMVRLMLEECSRKQVGNHSFTDVVEKYWDKADNAKIEIDVIAVNEESRTIRFGSCKRSAAKHTTESLEKFSAHVTRFMATKEGGRHGDWRLEKALYAPKFTAEKRQKLVENGYLPSDIPDFVDWLSQANATSQPSLF